MTNANSEEMQQRLASPVHCVEGMQITQDINRCYSKNKFKKKTTCGLEDWETMG